ncbi:hypothetical protein [Mycolicibacterium llatzerense]|uniref:hypothetical protein n=1 Tax=Mycolicibacterium llatzerense TaxID=280871 RepID=UPI0021B50C07|nr:hypothetical protein [Mycolicibacterium llatzerense]MCT7372694.1 hypothetical protein [Mycolicibacterium llatzerense]
MLTAAQLLTTLGDDTVELVIRDKDTATLDAWGRPTLTDRTVAKAGCSWQVTGGTEDLGGATIATLEARGMLPIDADTQALDSTAAVRHDGRLFELSIPGVTMRDGFGRGSHVRVYGRWADNVSLGELVTLVPAGRRHDGIVDPDGAPVDLVARAVTPGDARIQFGGTGPTIAADYTVVLDLGAPVRDGDWLIVRGRECRVMFGRQESQWEERRQLVVLAQYRGGGRT